MPVNFKLALVYMLLKTTAGDWYMLCCFPQWKG